jgi:hypothetical protein
MALRVKTGYSDLQHRQWTLIRPFYGDANLGSLPAVVRNRLSKNDRQYLQSLGPCDSANILAGDGSVRVEEGGPVNVSARNLQPPASLDTAEEVAIRATNIETGVDDNLPYVEVDGRRTRQDPVDGDHIVSLHWNVPNEQAPRSGGVDSAFQF